MALWGNTDNFAGRPKYTYPGKASVDVTATPIASNQITITRNKMQTGDALIYTAVGTAITGLTSGNTYYVIRIDSNTIKLASSLANANNGTALTISAGAGVQQFVNANIFFVDETEAQLKDNHDKGICGAGWWKWITYSDSNGDTRYKAELLIAMDVTAANAGDAADDAVVPDAESYATITAQPTVLVFTPTAPATQVIGTGMTVSVTGAGSATYQWQQYTTKWTNISGATSATYTTPATVAGTSTRYRCIVGTSGTGSATVTSSAITVTGA